MSEERLPAAPDWIEDQNPPAESKVEFARAESPLTPGWVTLEGEIKADSGEPYRVRASAEREHRRTLACYAETLYLRLDVVEDPPELADRLAELDAAAKEVDGSLEATIKAALEETDSDVRIVLETEPMSAGNSVVWAAKWSALAAGCSEVWHGPKWARMQVNIGAARLRGVTGGSPLVYGGGASPWEVGAGRCSVHAHPWTQYRLSNSWHR